MAERAETDPVTVGVPSGMVLDGAVVELGYADGMLIADVRIPAPRIGLVHTD
jgi:hypothetical protein